ncbi:MFS transporter [Alkalibacter mobilis]|uniref:MFS transporter n=1 Tax=Alkalibacter mobilis TaxID=2787712 RepID=UPI00189D9B16|nr:MFS transporter [Alkalibacter mobilis]MBF7096819.1 MFS transporter [Alkalibacter mobilis]
MKKNNLKRFLALTSIAFAYGTMYLLPYMKGVWYDQMIAATGFSNEQLGFLVTVYTIVLSITYIPGGWVADLIKPKKILAFSSALNGLLCFVFMMFSRNYAIAMLVWGAAGFTGGFAFWPAMLKGVRLLGTKDEQGRIYGIFEALNGIASLLASMFMVWISTLFVTEIAGFKGALTTMGSIGIIVALAVWFLFDENLTYNEDALSESSKIDLKSFVKTLVMPEVWIVALLMFVGVTIFDLLAYLTPYNTSFIGISAATASFIGTFRQYGCRVGGIGGGFMADKVLKSSALWQIVSMVAFVPLVLVFGLIPEGATVPAVIMGFVLALMAYAQRVTCYSLLTELQIPANVSGTALALVTLIGYSPDFFVHTMWGNWIDQHGNDSYQMIFNYNAVVAVIGILLALISFRMVRKKRQFAIQELSEES